MNDDLRDHLREGERAGLRYVLSLPRDAFVGTAGAVLGRAAGSSPELKDTREYQPGDDLRHVDWNAYARSDQLSIRLYREEVHPRVDVVVDATRSMTLEGSAKHRATLALTAFFAAVASNSSFARHVWLLGDELTPLVGANAMPSHWEVPALDQSSDNPGIALARAIGTWKPRGIRILLSDLLWNGDPLAVMRHFSERSALVIVVQILAQSDLNPPEPGNYRLIDAETNSEREIYVDAGVAQRYRDALTHHCDNWHQACRQAGALFTRVVAEDFLINWTLEDLVRADVLKVT